MRTPDTLLCMLRRRLLDSIVFCCCVLVPSTALAEPSRYLSIAAGPTFEARTAEPGLQNRIGSIGSFVQLGIPIPLGHSFSVFPYGVATQFSGTDDMQLCAACFRVERVRTVGTGLALRYSKELSGLVVYGQGGPAYAWEYTELSGGFTGAGDSLSSHHARLQAALGAAVPLGNVAAIGLRAHSYVSRDLFGAGVGLTLSLR